jgi:hypothetical protein
MAPELGTKELTLVPGSGTHIGAKIPPFYWWKTR